MRRREFITIFGGVTLLTPVATWAQQPQQTRRVAVLMGGLPEEDVGGRKEVSSFENGLHELGWNPGRNIELHYRWPGAELDKVTVAANEVIAMKPDLVVSRSTPATAAIINRGVPVVFVLVADPLGSAFVQNLSRPGGDVSGFSIFETSVGGKWLELLRQAAPTISRVSLLFNPGTAPFTEGYLASARKAALSLGATVIPAPCGSSEDIEDTFATRAREGGGIIIPLDTFLVAHRDLIVELAKRHRLPTMYGSDVYVPTGGLMSYAADYPDILRRAAAYVDKVLRGTHAGELPVQQPVKFRLSINLKTASLIGLRLPQSLVALADEVIE